MEACIQNYNFDFDLLSFDTGQNLLSYSLWVDHSRVWSMVQLQSNKIPCESWFQRILELLWFWKLVSFGKKCRCYCLSRTYGNFFNLFSQPQDLFTFCSINSLFLSILEIFVSFWLQFLPLSHQLLHTYLQLKWPKSMVQAY